MSLADGGWIAAFAFSLIAVLAASDRLVTAVEAAGDRYRWPAGLVGLLAAAGADGPEVSASFIALGAGAHDVSLGVILGSNLFNLAAVLALPILLVGFVAVQRPSMVLNGSAMVATTAIAELIVLGVLPAVPAVALVVAVLAIYGYMLVRPRALETAHPGGVPSPAPTLPGDVEEEERAREQEADLEQGFPSGRVLLRRCLIATAVIIGGCDVLVNATLYLGPRAGLSASFTGTFALAVLTSLPNVYVAIALARRHRGAVLVSAVCNSNTINAVFGICMPAPFTTFQVASVVRHLDVPALAAITLLSVALVWRGHGLGRPAALALVICYALFVGLRLTGS